MVKLLAKGDAVGRQACLENAVNDTPITFKSLPFPLKLLVVLLVLWPVVIVGLSAADIFLPAGWRTPYPPMSFEKSGQFGDSFGIVSALMAAVAAFYAYQTYRASQQEVELLRRRSAEPTFLNLLERRFDLLSNITRGATDGVAAVKNMADGIRANVERGQNQSAAVSLYMHAEKVSGLRNYFRYTYHIIRFAEDLFGVDATLRGPDQRLNGSYPYVRLLRAQLSDDELLLIALNAMHDADGKEFCDLIHRYGFLNNMAPADIERFKFAEYFGQDAFGWPAAPATPSR